MGAQQNKIMSYEQKIFDDRLKKFQERLFDPLELAVSSEERCERLRAGGYGQKIDMEFIDSHREYFRDWMTLQADWFRLEQKTMPAFMIGVASGGNRIALQQASLLNPHDTQVLQTKKNEKVTPSSPRLLPIAQMVIRETISYVPSAKICIYDDVGSTGSAAAEVTDQLEEIGVGKTNIEVIYSVQRSSSLTALEGRGIAYDAMITCDMPIYDSPEQYFEALRIKNSSVDQSVA